MEFLEEFGTEQLSEVSPSVVYKSTKVFVNGVWVGIHRDVEDLVNKLRQLRRQVYLLLCACSRSRCWQCCGVVVCCCLFITHP